MGFRPQRPLPALFLAFLFLLLPASAQPPDTLLTYHNLENGFSIGYPSGWSLLESDLPDSVAFLFSPEPLKTVPAAVPLGLALSVFRTPQETPPDRFDAALETLLDNLRTAAERKGGEFLPGPIRPVEREGLAGRRCRVRAKDAQGVRSESEIRLFFRGRRTYLVLWMADSGPNEAWVPLLEKALDSFRALDAAQAGPGAAGRVPHPGEERAPADLPDVTAETAGLLRSVRWADAGARVRPRHLAVLAPDDAVLADDGGVLTRCTAGQVTHPFGDARLGVFLDQAGKTLFLVGADGALRFAARDRVEEVEGLGRGVNEVAVLGGAVYVFRWGGDVVRIPLTGDAEPRVVARGLEVRDAPRPVAADGFLYFLARKKGSSPVEANEEIVLVQMVEREHRILSSLPRQQMPLDLVPLPDGILLRYPNRVMILDPKGLRQTDLPAGVDQMLRVGEGVFVLKQGGVLALAGEQQAVLDTGSATVRLLAAGDYLGFEKSSGELLYAPVKELLDATVRRRATINTDWATTALLVARFPARLPAAVPETGGAGGGGPDLAYVTPCERGGQTLWVQEGKSAPRALLVPGELRGVAGRPAWSPDRRFLALAADFATYDRSSPHLDVSVIEVATGRCRTLSRSRREGGFLFGYDAPSWRPDGKGLLVRAVRLPDPGEPGAAPAVDRRGLRLEEIHVNPAAGLPGDPDTLPRGPLAAALPAGPAGVGAGRWSPARSLLLAVAGGPEGAVVAVATSADFLGRLSALENNLLGDGLAWSPDGESLLGVWRQGKTTNLWSVTLATGRWRRVSSLEENLALDEYDWSRDGGSVYYAPGDRRRILRLDLASGQVEAVAEGGPFSNLSASAR